MKKKTFPFQQGDLNDHCMIYAIINLVAARTGRKGPTTSQKKFQTLARYIHMTDNFLRATIEGIDPWDLQELLDIAGGKLDPDCIHAAKPVETKVRTEMERPSRVANDLIAIAAQRHAIIFLRFEGGSDPEPATHYTVVYKEVGDQKYTLYDSYGYDADALTRTGDQWLLQDKPIVITDVFW